MREPPGPCGAGRLRCVCWAGPLCVPVAAARRVACCPDRFPAAAWPVVLGLAAVCAGGRRPAREIATREPGGSEWSISRPALALPPPTGTAAWPRRPRGGLQSGGAHCLCVVGQAPPPPTGTAAWPCCRPPAPRPGPVSLRRPRGGLQSGGAHCLCVVGQAPPPPTGTAAWPCRRPSISHAIPPRLFQTLNSQRWNCNVSGLC
ncbi:hypothetical protein HMPREF1478_00422 [Actinomyces sp. HPA0247]|nr:hypothetical protein HMPREF1478_00422 [Actinomyces sp. HPA0247]